MVLPRYRFYLHIIQNKVFHLSVRIFWHVDHRVQTLKLNKQNAHVKFGESRQFSLVFCCWGDGGRDYLLSSILIFSCCLLDHTHSCDKSVISHRMLEKTRRIYQKLHCLKYETIRIKQNKLCGISDWSFLFLITFENRIIWRCQMGMNALQLTLF